MDAELFFYIECKGKDTSQSFTLAVCTEDDLSSVAYREEENVAYIGLPRALLTNIFSKIDELDTSLTDQEKQDLVPINEEGLCDYHKQKPNQ
jgi:hypothetical protein